MQNSVNLRLDLVTGEVRLEVRGQAKPATFVRFALEEPVTRIFSSDSG